MLREVLIAAARSQKKKKTTKKHGNVRVDEVVGAQGYRGQTRFFGGGGAGIGSPHYFQNLLIFVFGNS